MARTLLLQALVAGILAAIAANIYDEIYFFATEIDYSAVLSVTTIVVLNLLVSLFAAGLYWLLTRIFPKKGYVIFNFVYSVGSFACVIIPIAKTLPLDTPSPEMFPGLTVPMVFFPVIAWMTVDPLFRK